MTEDDAKDWIADRHGDAAVDRISAFLALVADENERQNLVSPSTIERLWSRHAVDSAQLLAFAPEGADSWLDIGTGGGFPGMIVAMLFAGRVTMAEPRRRRADFLAHCVGRFGLIDAIVHQAAVEKVAASSRVISARAVATVEKLLQAAAHCARPDTRWILPRGGIDPATLSLVGGDPRLMFHVEHSLTDPGSQILVIDGAAS